MSRDEKKALAIIGAQDAVAHDPAMPQDVC
jgi:hypothetical protein